MATKTTGENPNHSKYTKLCRVVSGASHEVSSDVLVTFPRPDEIEVLHQRMAAVIAQSEGTYCWSEAVEKVDLMCAKLFRDRELASLWKRTMNGRDCLSKIALDMVNSSLLVFPTEKKLGTEKAYAEIARRLEVLPRNLELSTFPQVQV